MLCLLILAELRRAGRNIRPNPEDAPVSGANPVCGEIQFDKRRMRAPNRSSQSLFPTAVASHLELWPPPGANGVSYLQFGRFLPSRHCASLLDKERKMSAPNPPNVALDRFVPPFPQHLMPLLVRACVLQNCCFFCSMGYIWWRRPDPTGKLCLHRVGEVRAVCV